METNVQDWELAFCMADTFWRKIRRLAHPPLRDDIDESMGMLLSCIYTLKPLESDLSKLRALWQGYIPTATKINCEASGGLTRTCPADGLEPAEQDASAGRIQPDDKPPKAKRTHPTPPGFGRGRHSLLTSHQLDAIWRQHTEHVPNREIARRTGLDEKTIRNIIQQKKGGKQE